MELIGYNLFLFNNCIIFSLIMELNDNTEIYLDNLETAILLNQIGFDWYCVRYHGVCTDKENLEFKYYQRPSLYVAQKWLREIKNINIIIMSRPHGKKLVYYYVIEIFVDGHYEKRMIVNNLHKTYEGALNDAIRKSIEYILEKENK